MHLKISDSLFEAVESGKRIWERSTVSVELCCQSGEWDAIVVRILDPAELFWMLL